MDGDVMESLEANWRFFVNIYSNEIKISLKCECKYVRADLVLMDIVIRLGDEFTYLFT